MARKRMIDPAIWEDPDFGALSDSAKLFFIGLISHADDEGRLTGDPRALGRMVFGFQPPEPERVSTLLLEISTSLRSVCIYERDGRSYIALLKWSDYQTIQKKTASRIPAPKPDDYSTAPVVLQTASDNTTITVESLSDPATVPLRLKGKERSERSKNTPLTRSGDPPAEKPTPTALSIYRDVFRRYPEKRYQESFDKHFAHLGADEYRSRLESWAGHGWNPKNYLGQLDVLANGADARRTNGFTTKADRNAERLAEVAEDLELLRSGATLGDLAGDRDEVLRRYGPGTPDPERAIGDGRGLGRARGADSDGPAVGLLRVGDA